MKRMLHAIIALILCASMVLNLMPAQQIGLDISRAMAEEPAETAAPGTEAAGFSTLTEQAREQAANGGGKTAGKWQYAAFPSMGYAVITGYTGEETEVTVPDVIDGLDVVGIADGAMADAVSTRSITIPGNVLAMGDNALPAGAVIRSVNASYAQSWARKHGHAFENTSAYQFCADVVDFTGIREENYNRVSEHEVWLRELEANRVAVGKRFFLVDPSNAYQISYYQVKGMTPGPDGFVVLECETPELGAVVNHVTLENEPLVADLSTIQLSEGVTLGSSATRGSGDWSIKPSITIPLDFNAKKSLGNYAQVYFKGGVSLSYQMSLDFHWATMKSMKVTETEKAEITFGVKAGNDLATDKDEKEQKDYLNMLRQQNWKNKEHFPVAYADLGKVVLFTYGGIATVLMDMRLQFELSGKVEITASYSCTTVYTRLENGEWQKKSSGHSFKVDPNMEGELKIGFVFALELYAAVLKIASLDVFIGFDLKATINFLDFLISGTSSSNQDDHNLFRLKKNLNMTDAIILSVDFIVEVRVSVGIGEHFSVGTNFRILTIPIVCYHIHVWPDVMTYNESTQQWEVAPGGKGTKDHFHHAEDCPYDFRTFTFSTADDTFYLDKALHRRISNPTLAVIDNMLYGETISKDTPDQIAERFKNQYHLKILSWHTDNALDDASKVTFPYTVGKTDQTFYPKTVPYHKIHLINAAGKEIQLDDLAIEDEETHYLYTLKNRNYRAATDELLTLPTKDDKGRTVTDIQRVYSPTNFRVRNDYMPGSQMRIPEFNEEDIYLLILTDQDVAGTYIVSNKNKYYAYCARNGILTAPAIQNPSGQRLSGWIEDSSGDLIQPEGTFDTSVTHQFKYTFYAKFEPDPDYIAPSPNEQLLGNPYAMQGTLSNPGKTIDELLTFSGGTITGVQPGISLGHLIIPEYRADNTTPITAIAAEAFKGNSTLTAVTLNTSIRTIGNYAFANCANLEYIIADGVYSTVDDPNYRKLPSYFAYNCPELKGVRLPNNVRGLHSYAFAQCPKLSTAKLNCVLEAYALAGDTGLQTVELGGGCTHLYDHAFGGCTGLERLELSMSTAVVSNDFIAGCTGLKTIIANGLFTTVYTDTFRIGSGSALEEIVLGPNITTLKEGALANGTNGFPNLKSITIPASVTSIGANCLKGSGIEELTVSLPSSKNGSGEMASNLFTGMNSLRKVTIVAGRIPASAFAGNTALEEVVIEGGVIAIGESAFANCTGLESVTIEEGVDSIGKNAFAGCTGLTSLYFPDSITSYGAGMISGCNDITSLRIGGGCAELEAASGGMSTVTNPFYIGPSSKLQELVLREGITSLGEGVFANGKNSSYPVGYTQMTSITLPSSLTSMGKNVFGSTPIRELILDSGLASASSAFKGMTALQRVTIKGGSIGDMAFSGCTGLTSVTLEEGVTSIGTEAFRGCTGLTSLSFPDSVTYYGYRMLYGCTNLTYLKIGGGKQKLSAGSYATSYETDSRNPFIIGSASKLKTLVLSEGITTLEGGVFANGINGGNGSAYPELSSVSLPSTMTSIGSKAFGTAPITELTLSPGLAAANSAFQNMTSLQRVTVKGGSIGSMAFSGCTGLKSVTLEEGVTSIGTDAFRGCTGLTSLSFPDSVTYYGYRMIYGCKNLTYLKIGGGLQKLSAGSYATSYGNESHNPFIIGSESKLKTLVFSEGITTIESGAFANGINGNNPSAYPELSSVSLPSTLTSIGSKAFGTAPITELTLSPGLAAANSAFQNMTSLQRVTVKGGSIGSMAFSGCTGLKSVTLEEGVTSIGTEAFRGCTGLTSLSFPDSVTYYGYRMIYGCTNLTYLKIGGGQQRLSAGNASSSYASNSNNPFIIGSESKLKTLVLSEGITTLESGVFANGINGGNGSAYPELSSVSLPSTLTSIGSKAFGTAPITELILSPGLAAANSAFQNMTSLQRVTVKGGSIGSMAFSGCTGLKSVTLEEGVTSIGTEAFRGCTGLTSLSFPDSVTYYGYRMIYGCTNLTYLKIGGGQQRLSAGNYATSYENDSHNPFIIGSASKLKTLVLSEGITILESGAFANGINSSNLSAFSQLTFVELPSTLVSIGSGNLSAWKNVRSLVLPDGLTSISDNRSLPSDLMLYTNLYNSYVDTFAGNKSLSYLYADKSTFPRRQLTRVIRGGSSGGRAAVTVTRGTEGEEILLPDGFSILSTEEITFTDPVEAEEPPTGENEAFYGWYTDPDFTEPWGLNSMPDADVTLYARIEPLLKVTYAINMAPASGPDESLPAGFTGYTTFRVRSGAELPVPADPATDGFTFCGWYMDPDFLQEAIPKQVQTDLTICGRMERVPAGATYRFNGEGYTLTSYRVMEDESTEVHIPASVNGYPVTAIADGAFSKSGAARLYLPDTVTTIGSKALQDSAIHYISVSKNNPVYTSVSGFLYNHDQTALILCPPGWKRSAASIPTGVTSIGEGAFRNNRYLTSVSFPEGLTEIGREAFMNCSALQSVTLPDSVGCLGDNAFSGCDSMTAFTAYGLTEIGENALPVFTGLKGYGPLGTGVLRDQFRFSYKEQGTNQVSQFILNYNMYTLKLMVDGVSAAEIGCEAGIPLPGMVEDDNADGTPIPGWFRDSDLSIPWDLASDLMPETNLTLYTSTAALFSYETAEIETGEGTVNGLKLTAYHGRAATVTVPPVLAGSPVIALDSTFPGAQASQIGTLNLPASLISIEDGALTGFSGAIVCDADSYAAEWADAHSFSLDVITYTLTYRAGEQTLKTQEAAKGTLVALYTPAIPGQVFNGWFTDEALTIPAETNENGLFRMPGTAVTLFSSWEEEPEIAELPFTWKVDPDRNEAIITGYTGSSDFAVIPQEIASLPVTAIADEAFAHSRIRGIDLGGIIRIGANAFSDCVCLGSITLPDTVVALGENAFGGCSALKVVNIGAGLNGIDPQMFITCPRLSSVNVSEDNMYLSSAGGVLFSKDFSRLILYPAGKTAAEYSVSEGVTEIGNYAFCGCAALESISLPDSVSRLGDYAFRDCAALAQFTGNGVTSIGTGTFFSDRMLNTLRFSGEMTGIGTAAFGGCAGLKTITIPASVSLDVNELYFSINTAVTIIGTAGSSADLYAQAHQIAFTDPDAQAVTGISLAEETLVLQRGDTYAMAVSLLPENAAQGTGLLWSSADESVAFADDENVIHAVGGGETILTVRTGNGLTASVNVEVQVAVRSVLLSSETTVLHTGSDTQLSTEILPASATDKTLTWISDHPEIIQVDENGFVTALQDGFATITATAHNGTQAALALESYTPVESVSFTVPQPCLFLREGYNRTQITASFQPENATDQVIHWSTNSPEVATVDENGTVTATGAGNAIITAQTDGSHGSGKATYLYVTVYAADNVLVLPAALTTIGEEAFAGDTSVQGIILGSQADTIGPNAFAGMTSLVFLDIPSSVQTIADSALDNTDAIILCEPGSEAWEYAGNHGLTRQNRFP